MRNRRPRKPLSKTQTISIVTLWVALTVMLLVYSKEINAETIFTIIASGLIILLAISKNR